MKAFYKQFGAVFELDDGTLAFARVSVRVVRQVLHSYLGLLGREARRRQIQQNEDNVEVVCQIIPPLVWVEM